MAGCNARFNDSANDFSSISVFDERVLLAYGENLISQQTSPLELHLKREKR